MVSDLAFRFAKLFEGRDDAYGLGAGGVVRAPVTTELYGAHLEGADPIGIFPLRNDGTVRFGAIDLDEPNFELARTMQKLLPGASWIERSRSGNAHVWAFFEADAPAWAVRTILRGATESLGRPDVEIFPKQDRVREGGVGNYINLPYHGDERPILVEGIVPGPDPSPALVPLEPADFVERAERDLLAPAEWESRARLLGGRPPEERERQSEFGTAGQVHRCGVYIFENREANPLRAGHRHNVLFHVAHQFLNSRDWSPAEVRRDIIDPINAAADQPLAEHEVDRLMRNAQDGGWTYTGCDDPVMAPYIDPSCPIAGNGRSSVPWSPDPDLDGLDV